MLPDSPFALIISTGIESSTLVALTAPILGLRDACGNDPLVIPDLDAADPLETVTGTMMLPDLIDTGHHVMTLRTLNAWPGTFAEADVDANFETVMAGAHGETVSYHILMSDTGL